MDHPLAGGADYFATYDFTEDWTRGEHTVRMRFWHRPLRAMVTAMQEAGFTIDVVDEPEPEPALRELDPVAWRSLTTEPRFIFFAATPNNDAAPR